MQAHAHTFTHAHTHTFSLSLSSLSPPPPTHTHTLCLTHTQTHTPSLSPSPSPPPPPHTHTCWHKLPQEAQLSPWTNLRKNHGRWSWFLTIGQNAPCPWCPYAEWCQSTALSLGLHQWNHLLLHHHLKNPMEKISRVCFLSNVEQRPTDYCTSIMWSHLLYSSSLKKANKQHLYVTSLPSTFAWAHSTKERARVHICSSVLWHHPLNQKSHSMFMIMYIL